MSKALTALFAITCLLIFQNCSPFETDAARKLIGIADFASTGGDDLVPPTDKIDSACMQSSAYDACLFRKNPVSAKGQIFSGSIVSPSLDTLQVYGVKLTGVAKTGRLENDTFKILTLTGQPLTTSTNNFRYRAYNDRQQIYSQVAAYYWLNRALEYVSARTGLFPAKDKGIKVYVDDTFAGWSSRTNSIHLKLDSTGNSMAWSAELAVHFLGLANLHHATNGAINTLGTGAENIHRDCGLKPNGCCTAQVGCGRAIASGVGDYFSALLFPDQPIVGEAWANRVEGLAACGINRNLATTASLSASTVFNSCSSVGLSGDTTIMGSLYASIWWEARRAAANADGTNGAREIDTLFMEHLSTLRGTDNFNTAIEKARSIDARLFNGRYSPLLSAQLAARGL